MKKGISAGPARFRSSYRDRQVWSTAVLELGKHILSGDTARWFPQGKAHPQQEKSLRVSWPRSKKPWEWTEERGRGMCFCAAGWNQCREVKWRGVHCERGSLEQGDTMRRVRSQQQGGGQQLKSRPWWKLVQGEIKDTRTHLSCFSQRVFCTAVPPEDNSTAPFYWYLKA